jgi:hypothetical protein
MIPPPKLAGRTAVWAKAVHEQYKHYSHNMASRDRSVTVSILDKIVSFLLPFMHTNCLLHAVFDETFILTRTLKG